MKVGDPVPEFHASDETGTLVSLSELTAQGPLVLFFYPAAMTPGCTKESCHFRDLQAEFAALGAQVVGISADGVNKQAQFRERFTLGYPLLSDPDHRLASTFGVRRPLGLPNRRTTFVLSQDHQVLARIGGEFAFSRHADEALEVLRRTGSQPAGH